MHHFRSKGYLIDQGKKLPLIDEVRFEVMKEEQPRWLNFMAGKLDRTSVPKEHFNQAVTERSNLTPEFVTKGYQLHSDLGIKHYYVTFNMQDPADDKFLRQAISSALDRDKWVELFTSGTGRKMTHAMPPGLAGRPEKSKILYDYNLARAKELMVKAVIRAKPPCAEFRSARDGYDKSTAG